MRYSRLYEIYCSNHFVNGRPNFDIKRGCCEKNPFLWASPSFSLRFSIDQMHYARTLHRALIGILYS